MHLEKKNYQLSYHGILFKDLSLNEAISALGGATGLG